MKTSLKRSLILAAALSLFVVPAAHASSTIVDTRDDANLNFISSYAVPNTATYGQTITSPADPNQKLTSFTFRVENVPNTLLSRAEVYAWDDGTSKATGSALYESGIRETDFSIGVTELTFNTGGIALVPSTRYVLFLSVSKDFEASAGAAGRFRSTDNDTAYPGGTFFYQNNGTSEADWTGSPWSLYGEDLQFAMTFSTGAQALTITKSGNGSGTVTSSVGGVNCGSLCSVVFGDNTIVALQANAATGSNFELFTGGGCNFSPCAVKMDGDKTIDARFTDTTAPKTTITKRKGSKIYFSSNEKGSTFNCKLDKSKSKTCRSPYKAKGLKSGKHKFSVYAIDKGKNKGRAAKLKFTT
ncbi:MAG: hypothetical protein ACRDKI_00265 [Solirubrobacterales bacterium]